MSFFELTIPEPIAPVLVEIPHAGLWIPEALEQEIDVPRASVLRDADIYVDGLYEGAVASGAARLAARVSRYVVDLNRAADDVDPCLFASTSGRLLPRGVVWRATTDGQKVNAAPLTAASFQRRLATYYTPYHRRLRQTLNELQGQCGFAILVAAHSMPSRSRLRDAHPGPRRADIVTGTQGGTTADPAVIEIIERHFRDVGLSVARDEPYRGGFSTQYYGNPAGGVHAVQIEINRALYVDETTQGRLPDQFEALQLVLNQLIRKLTGFRF